jgi:hypothetical protein
MHLEINYRGFCTSKKYYRGTKTSLKIYRGICTSINNYRGIYTFLIIEVSRIRGENIYGVKKLINKQFSYLPKMSNWP